MHRISQHLIGLGVSALTCAISANQPPVITLPNTDSVVVAAQLIMPGSVSDDSTPADLIRTEWLQIAPDTPRVVIADSSYLHISIFFPVVGRYAFQLTATDGALTSRDTLVVICHEPRPFVILAPAVDEEVLIGQSYTIVWQREPTFACRILLSTDDGLTFDKELSNKAEGSGVFRPTLRWNVDSTYANGTVCVLKISNYIGNAPEQTCRFFLVKQKSAVIPKPDVPVYRRAINERRCSFDASGRALSPMFERNGRYVSGSVQRSSQGTEELLILRDLRQSGFKSAFSE